MFAGCVKYLSVLLLLPVLATAKEATLISGGITFSTAESNTVIVKPTMSSYKNYSQQDVGSLTGAFANGEQTPVYNNTGTIVKKYWVSNHFSGKKHCGWALGSKVDFEVTLMNQTQKELGKCTLTTYCNNFPNKSCGAGISRGASVSCTAPDGSVQSGGSCTSGQLVCVAPSSTSGCSASGGSFHTMGADFKVCDHVGC